MNLDNIKSRISSSIEIFSLIEEKSNLKKKETNLESINLLLNDQKNWNDVDFISEQNKKKAQLEKQIFSIKNISEKMKNIKEISDIVEENDLETISDIEKEFSEMEKQIFKMKTLTMFSNEEDESNSFLEINAGAGGTDSQDWAEMILRMYTMWAQKNNFDIELIDRINSEEAGIKNVTLKISGEYAYGWLKSEIGVHRLVRISPFNSNGKRQTSFASVFAYPVVSEKINIEILESDLRIDTYRSSGAGGQHVNKTESAVRITHIPTGLVTQSQTQRSQIQNKAEAIKMLKSKLYELEMRKKQTEKDKANSSKMQISFGSQIRNYVLHPYQLVKDLRSNYETSQTQSILDGNLDEIMESVILGG